MLRDDQDADLHLTFRQRGEFVEERPDPLHAAGDGRTMDPDLVGAEDAPATGGELVEHRGLRGREMLRRNFENTIHDVKASLG
jgi:hypothetical protein